MWWSCHYLPQSLSSHVEYGAIVKNLSLIYITTMSVRQRIYARSSQTAVCSIGNSARHNHADAEVWATAVCWMNCAEKTQQTKCEYEIRCSLRSQVDNNSTSTQSWSGCWKIGKDKWDFRFYLKFSHDLYQRQLNFYSPFPVSSDDEILARSDDISSIVSPPPFVCRSPPLHSTRAKPENLHR